MVENQGKNDSFFAGEEYMDQEAVNPNIDMGFSKFRFEAKPDFVITNAKGQQDVMDEVDDNTDDHGSQN